MPGLAISILYVQFLAQDLGEVLPEHQNSATRVLSITIQRDLKMTIQALNLLQLTDIRYQIIRT